MMNKTKNLLLFNLMKLQYKILVQINQKLITIIVNKIKDLFNQKILIYLKIIHLQTKTMIKTQHLHLIIVAVMIKIDQ